MRSSKPARRRRPASYYEVAGLDLDCEMRRLCALPIFGGSRGPLARKPPVLTVRRASARPRRNLGFAVPAERRISVTAYPGIRPGDAQETLLHELVHIALGRHDGGWHGSHFRQTLAKAMRQGYGIDGGRLSPPPAPPEGRRTPAEDSLPPTPPYSPPGGRRGGVVFFGVGRGRSVFGGGARVEYKAAEGVVSLLLVGVVGTEGSRDAVTVPRPRDQSHGEESVHGRLRRGTSGGKKKHPPLVRGGARVGPGPRR